MIVSDYTQMDRILKEERNYIISLIKKIKASGCNVLLIQKSILRDAVTDLSLHYLAKAKILVVRDVERDDVEFISKTLKCQPVAHVDQLTPDKLGHADVVKELLQCRSVAVDLALTNDGVSPLMAAAWRGDVASVRALVEADAAAATATTAPNEGFSAPVGSTALDIARQHGRAECAVVLAAAATANEGPP